MIVGLYGSHGVSLQLGFADSAFPRHDFKRQFISERFCMRNVPGKCQSLDQEFGVIWMS
jgi:hypothetical protein